MINFLGYNFCKDKNCIDPIPVNIDGLNYTKIQNGNFNHLNIDSSTDKEYNADQTFVWNYSTILNANFNGNIIGGNINEIFSDVTALRVKRRKVDSFDWVFLFDVPINGLDDLTFNRFDMLNQNGVEYQYAIIPIVNNIEGTYAINTVESWFDGIFICDQETIFKFYAGVSYGETEAVQKTGIFEPLGSKYPIVVSNSVTGYKKGNITGKATSPELLETRILDRFQEKEFAESVIDFLNNKKAKLLKDWNGNVWLVMIVDSPKVSYSSDIGMGLMDISASWAEIGDYNSNEDLISTGIVSVASNEAVDSTETDSDLILKGTIIDDYDMILSTDTGEPYEIIFNGNFYV